MDDVGVLNPFTTRSGGDWPSGALVAEGFRALTTSLMALILLVCLTRDLIGLAHRGSGIGDSGRGEVRTIQKQTSEFSHSIRTPSSEKGLSLVSIRSMDEVPEGGPLSLSDGDHCERTHTKPVGLDTISLLILLCFFKGEDGGRAGETCTFAAGPSGPYLGPAITLGLDDHWKRRDGDGVGIMARRS